MEHQMSFDIAVLNHDLKNNRSAESLALTSDIPNGKLFILLHCNKSNDISQNEILRFAGNSLLAYLNARLYENVPKALSNSISHLNSALTSNFGSHKGIDILIAVEENGFLHYAFCGAGNLLLIRNSLAQNLSTSFEDTEKNQNHQTENLPSLKYELKIGVSKKPIPLLKGDVFLFSGPKQISQDDLKKIIQIAEEPNKSSAHKSEEVKLIWPDESLIFAEWVKKSAGYFQTAYSAFNRYFVTMFMLIIVIAVCYYAAEKFFAGDDLPLPAKTTTVINKQSKQVDVISEPETVEQPEILKKDVKDKAITKYTLKDTLISHVIISGETLYRIALRYHISVGELEQLNAIKAANIRAGKKIKIPVAGFVCISEKISLDSLAGIMQYPVELISKANLLLGNETDLTGKCLVIPKK